MQIEAGDQLGEGLRDRLHHSRVKCVEGLEPAGGHALGGQPLRQPVDGVGGTGDDGLGGPVDRGQRQLLAEKRRRLLLGEREREHRAAGQSLNHPCSLGDQSERILQREDSGETGGHVLADAVAHHGARPDPKFDPHLCQRILDREEGGLGENGPVQLPGPLAGLTRAAPQHAQQVE